MQPFSKVLSYLTHIKPTWKLFFWSGHKSTKGLQTIYLNSSDSDSFEYKHQSAMRSLEQNIVNQTTSIHHTTSRVTFLHHHWDFFGVPSTSFVSIHFSH